MEYKVGRSDLKDFALEIVRRLKGGSRPVFMCVGSDKFVCDSLAPLVSELLTKKYNINAYVYGGLEYNITAHTLTTAINYIETMHPGSQIVLIDATLGEGVGRVVVGDGGYAGMGRVLPIRRVGDFSILGVVGTFGGKFNLNSTRLGIVLNLSKFIAKGIAMAMSVAI